MLSKYEGYTQAVYTKVANEDRLKNAQSVSSDFCPHPTRKAHLLSSLDQRHQFVQSQDRGEPSEYQDKGGKQYELPRRQEAAVEPGIEWKDRACIGPDVSLQKRVDPIEAMNPRPETQMNRKKVRCHR